MKETNYKKSVRRIVGGFAQLGVSVWHSIYNHPALTALVVSMMCNVWLFVSMANAKVERDLYNTEATEAALKLDSISQLLPNSNYERK